MEETLLNEDGWKALANIRLRRLEEVNAENERLRAALVEIEEFTSDAPDDDPLSHVCGVARVALGLTDCQG